jgi:hypothetical protein
MNESFPNKLEKNKKEQKIELARELDDSGEVFLFPGIKDESYQQLRSEEEEFPGFVTPINTLLKRFVKEGMKVVLGKNSASGNVFILPADSNNIEADSLFPRHLKINSYLDKRVKKLINL